MSINTALAALTATAAIGQDAPVLAEYRTDSGSLPPEYAWETSVTILEDRQLTLKHCKGYETDGPACKTRKATVSAAGEKTETYDQAAGIFEKMSLSPDYPEFLTLPLYEATADSRQSFAWELPDIDATLSLLAIFLPIVALVLVVLLVWLAVRLLRRLFSGRGPGARDAAPRPAPPGA